MGGHRRRRRRRFRKTFLFPFCVMRGGSLVNGGKRSYSFAHLLFIFMCFLPNRPGKPTVGRAESEIIESWESRWNKTFVCEGCASSIHPPPPNRWIYLLLPRLSSGVLQFSQGKSPPRRLHVRASMPSGFHRTKKNTTTRNTYRANSAGFRALLESGQGGACVIYVRMIYMEHTCINNHITVCLLYNPGIQNCSSSRVYFFRF